METKIRPNFSKHKQFIGHIRHNITIELIKAD